MKTIPLETIVVLTGGVLSSGPSDLMISSAETSGANAASGALIFDLHNSRYPDLRLPYFPHDRPCAIITDRPASWFAAGEDLAIIQVKNSDSAYWTFVDYYRSLFHIPIVGVTGTCGKTTTKEMIRYLLELKYSVRSTYKSMNARAHHFRYLTELDDTVQAGVYELGVAAPGDMKVACRYFRPQVGVITNIGIDHLMMFGTQEAYIREKARMLEYVGDGGTMVLNADDEGTQRMDSSICKGNILWYGTSPRADYRLMNIRPVEKGMQFLLRYHGRNYHFFIPLYGAFNVYNAVAAIAASHVLGIDVARAGAHLAGFQNVEKHFELSDGINGSTVIDDTWSTNPTSAYAALELLMRVANGKKSVAVLGKMSLLGRQSPLYHHALGEKVSSLGVDTLVVLGADAYEIGAGALKSGMPPQRVIFCRNSAEAFRALKKLLNPGTVALVKTTMLASYTGLMSRIVPVRDELDQ
ncbi:MAG: UDP-N-acetylmuramoyl-tripeptide--D-alanyl-D-alanine ligase [Clostridia bacterium]|nr:UDP-N-acetylmuramoyl-tripeptide--D-alanyl-D-alanine ligase [Clostridia bacterium]